MALSDDRLDELSREMVKGRKSVNWLAAMIEAEVRKDDEALIRQMLEALDGAQTEAMYGNAYGRCDTTKFDAPIAAARARMTPCPGQRQPE